MNGRGSLPIGSVLGFPVRVHWTLPVALLVLGVAGGGGALGFLLVLAIAAGLFGSVLLHELGHAVVARRLGVQVQGILLTPLGGMSFLTSQPRRPRDEALIAAAGPAVSLLLAAVFAGAYYGIEGGTDPTSPLAALLAINLIIGLFNLVPAFPMDGGRLLRAALTTRMGIAGATHTAAGVGRFLAVLAIGWGLASGTWMLALVAVFVLVAGRLEERGVVTREVIAGLVARQVMQTPVTALDPVMGASAAWEIARMIPQAVFPVLWGDRVLGIVARADLARLKDDGHGNAPLSMHIDREVPRVDEEATVEEVLRAMVEAKRGAAVVTREGQLSGVLTVDDMLRRAARLRAPGLPG
ncbi:MAG: protease [Myxococcales bacterium]